MESMQKDSPIHYFLTTADLPKFTGKEISEYLNGSFFHKQEITQYLQLSQSCITMFTHCFNAGVS